ncbi:unnamed protein product [Chrysodeixis includens]|uniref:C2H2-type domain-containing protein n=1 Tax=Chrysodeixis includens TaxID=689277 RepID=A0A9P0C4Q2_CHRIL|nr:unnamed protein product [Chrysodeixis includens]
MAGNKMSTKTRGKEDKSKANNKTIGQPTDETDETDFALLRKPIHTSITGFGQARKIFDLATEELKDLLSNECDLLYECKVCRNIFRSLANFISHKRVYCKEKFSSSLHSHFIKATSTVTEIMKIKQLEEGYQESLKETIETENKETDEVDERVPLTKDLTAIVEKIAQHKGVQNSSKDEPQIALQKIPNSSVAMFQNVQMCEDKQKENMRVQVNELDKILSRDVAVLQSDGNFKIKSSAADDSDNVIQISDDDDNDDADVLKCKTCDMQFSTQKTLKFHMKYKHVESRLVYPCPDCLEIFSTSWSVYRHLFKVHRKTAAQIRRLRESIQAKAFKMNNPPAFYEKRKNNMKSAATAPKITEEERIDQENQAWMDNMEGDGELPRCGGCGRTFERRAALAAHTHTCQPRSRALARRPQETKKIEIQIRKDYNKGPPANITIPPKPTENNENKAPKEDPPVVVKSSPSKEEEKSADTPVVVEEEKEVEETMDISEDEQKSNDASESPELELDPEPELEPEPEKSQVELSKLTIRLPFAHQAEKNNLMAFRQRLQSEVELNKLLCKRCDGQFGEVQELFDHVADHIKWYRYACKLCNFKHYYFDKLPEHVKVVHKLKGDKDFYYSTVKAVNGSEAMELCLPPEELPENNETSPDSRRPSRCSSDSSRLSDDSSSSSTRVEGMTRKRKIYQTKNSSKRRKEFLAKGGHGKHGDIPLDKNIRLEENDSSNIKNFEENSSDIDEIEEKVTKRRSTLREEKTSVASRRPVRRKTKPKNEDFEYDLSNLLKLEAQGYRDSLTMAQKVSQTKRRVQQEINYENANKECCGALVALSKKSVERAGAHMKTNFPGAVQKDVRTQNVFVRPMLPKLISKASQKSDNSEEPKESSPSKENVSNKLPVEEPDKSKDEVPKDNSVKSPKKTTDEVEPASEVNQSTVSAQPKSPTTPTETVKPKPMPAMVPIKFRRQSLDVMKNPLINKSISDFTKSGMKTKILVIKPINRNKDGKQTLNSPLKFQTIKLKDPNKNSCNEEKDQVVVVKVPKVDCAVARPTSEVPNKNTEKTSQVDKPTVSENNSNSNDATSADADDVEIIKPTDIDGENANMNNNIGDELSDTNDDVVIKEDIKEPAKKDTVEL